MPRLPESALITGAAGFGGSRLTKALLGMGWRVTMLDVTPPSHATILGEALDNPRATYLWKSVQDIQPDDVAGHSIVVHLAAQPDTPMAFESPRYTVTQNVDGTIALLEAVRRAGGVSKLMFAGSGNEYGRALYMPIDESHPLTPHNPYGFSKAAAELALWAWHRAYGVPSVIMGTGVVIGQNMRREVFIFKWLWNAMRGKPIMVEGGAQTRDVTFIEDVVDAWTLAIRARADTVVGEKFHVGYGEERSIDDLAEMCRDAAAAITGVVAPIERVGYRPGEAGQREAFSGEKARRVLGYAPKVGPEEAIARTARWVAELTQPRRA